MPLRWTIDHATKFIHIVADGPVTMAEMEEHFDAIAVAEAMGYAKLFDASRLVPVYTDDDVMAMAARLSAYTAALETGPLAVVGESEVAVVSFRRFVNISPSTRPARLFATENEARAWLATQAATVQAPPGSTLPPPKKKQTRRS
jgi:hypothetical protein